jgi:Tol biopolymer transport system component
MRADMISARPNRRFRPPRVAGARAGAGLCAAAALLIGGCADSGDQAEGPDGLPSLVTIAMQAPPAHGIVALTPRALDPTVASDAGAALDTAWLFQAPTGSEVRQLDVSADGRRLVYAFVPPPDDRVQLLDRSALYLVDLDATGWAPRLLPGGGDRADEFLLEPALSPDGRYCYYVHVTSSDDDLSGYTTVTLRRLDIATGETLTIIENGIWPTVSGDAEQIAFVGVQPRSRQRGLFTASADGSELRMLVPVGRFFDIDAPVFSPDNRSVWFAVAEQDTREQPRSSWWQRLPGVSSAHAHNDHDVKSDWWRVSVDGGEPQRMTEVQKIMTYGAFVPGEDTFVFVTTDGIYQLDPDGGTVVTLSAEGSWMSLGWLLQP